MDEPGGVVVDKFKSSLDQYTPHATSALVEQVATPLDLWTGRSAPVSKAHALNGQCRPSGISPVLSQARDLCYLVHHLLPMVLRYAVLGISYQSGVVRGPPILHSDVIVISTYTICHSAKAYEKLQGQRGVGGF